MTRLLAGRAIRILIAAALTAFLLWKSDPAAVWRVSIGSSARFLAIAALLVVLDRALMAYRWLVLLGPVTPQTRPPLGVVMRIFFVSTFVGTFLPASVGGDAVRAYSLARHHVSAPAAIASVVMDRVMGVLGLLVLAAASLFFAPAFVDDRGVMLVFALTTAGCLAAAALVFSESAAALASRALARVGSGGIERRAGDLLAAIQRYGSHHRELFNVLVGSVLVQVLRVIQAYYLGLALDIQAPLGVYFAFVPLILLIMLLPITVNGIGTSQAAFLWLFGGAGVARPDAFALSVLFVALGIVGNVPGGLLYVTSGLGPQTTGRVQTR